MPIGGVKDSTATKSLGTTSEYIKLLKAEVKKEGLMKIKGKSENSVWTGYLDETGKQQGGVCKVGKATAIQIRDTDYIDYDGDHKIDRIITHNPDGSETVAP